MLPRCYINHKVNTINQFTLGVIGTSKKEDEARIPIHPEHLERISEETRGKMIFEEGYGKPFGIFDTVISEMTGGVASRSEILANSNIVVIAKPIPVWK